MKASTVTINGTQIYYETRGSGPSLLFISGMTGDAGHFTKVGDILADEYTVVTYDRRGNSRSPRPAGWTATSMDEQADDAAGLIKTLHLAPTAAFGNSGGAIILLNVAARYPRLLRGAIFHEPPLVSILPNPQEVMGPMESMLAESISKGGPRHAMEVFLRVAAGDRVYDSFEPGLRERMLGNAELGLSIEMKAFISYVPESQKIRAARVPVVVAEGAETAGNPQIAYLDQCCKWLAGQLGTVVHELPGAHAGFWDRPKQFVDALRPLLKKLS